MYLSFFCISYFYIFDICLYFGISIVLYFCIYVSSYVQLNRPRRNCLVRLKESAGGGGRGG